MGNSKEAGNLAQELLASQYNAIKLSTGNPLGGFTDAIKAALEGVRDLRDELAKLGAPKVPIAPIATPTIPISPSIYDKGVFPFVPLSNGVGYDSKSPALTNTEIRIFLDPMAAAAGVTAAVIDNAANGNSNSYSPIFSWAGGFN